MEEKGFWDTGTEEENIALLEKIARIRDQGVDVEAELDKYIASELNAEEAARASSMGPGCILDALRARRINDLDLTNTLLYGERLTEFYADSFWIASYNFTVDVNKIIEARLNELH